MEKKDKVEEELEEESDEEVEDENEYQEGYGPPDQVPLELVHEQRDGFLIVKLGFEYYLLSSNQVVKLGFN